MGQCCPLAPRPSLVEPAPMCSVVPAHHRGLTCTPPPHSDEEPEVTLLPKDKLISLCRCEPILQWMRSCDHILYQALVETLIPDVLRPVPSKPPSQGPAPPQPPLSPEVPLTCQLHPPPDPRELSARQQGAKLAGACAGLSRRFPGGQARAAKSHLLGKPLWPPQFQGHARLLWAPGMFARRNGQDWPIREGIAHEPR